MERNTFWGHREDLPIDAIAVKDRRRGRRGSATGMEARIGRESPSIERDRLIRVSSETGPA